MKFFRTFLCLFILLIAALQAPRAQAQIPPKAKAYLVMSAYGTVGGALLGFASLAFQNNPRAIAQGASLGLYAGMIFGAYVLTSYQRPGTLPGEEYPADPYQDPSMPPPGFGPEGAPGSYPPADGLNPNSPPPSSGGGFFGSRSLELQDHYASNYKSERGSLTSPPLYLNLIHVNF